ncbi:MAG: F0F1 ATP synthase subunit A [Anaeromyxobacter sp.]
MTLDLATLALVLALGQHEPAPATAPAEHAPAAQGALAPVEAEHGAPAAPGHEEHGAAVAGEHGAAAAHHGGKHDESLGGVMMHHVSDGRVMEYPGVCETEGPNGPEHGFAWNCELELDHLFGTVRDAETGKAVSGPLVFGSLDMTPTKHVMMMWLASAILLVIAFTATRKRSLVPRGIYNFVEVLVAFVRNDIAVKNIGEKDADRFTPYLVTAFFFILFMNLLGLVPFAATATANLSVTVALALFTFVITQWAAIRAMGIGGFLAHMTGGVPKSLAWLWPIMIPVEFLGLFTKPFALTVRLFANMVAGHFVILALLGLIFALKSQFVAVASVPMALGIFMLELFVAFVQAYIFAMLSALFIGSGLVHHGHDEEHGDGHGHGHEDHGHAQHA